MASFGWNKSFLHTNGLKYSQRMEVFFFFAKCQWVQNQKSFLQWQSMKHFSSSVTFGQLLRKMGQPIVRSQWRCETDKVGALMGGWAWIIVWFIYFPPPSIVLFFNETFSCSFLHSTFSSWIRKRFLFCIFDMALNFIHVILLFFCELTSTCIRSSLT